MSEIQVKVTKHGNRKFFVMYYDCPETGKRFSKSTKQTRRRDAEKAAGKWQEQLEQGTYQPRSKLSWQAFVIRFENERMPALAPKTQAAIDSALNHVRELLAPSADTGKLRLHAVDAQALSRLQAKLRETGIRETSIACHLRHVRVVLSWGAKMKFIREVPAIDMPKVPKGARHMKGAPITEAEFRLMLAAVPSVRPDDAEFWRSLLWGLWYSGLRLGEAMALSWDRNDSLSVDFTGKRPRLRIYAEAQKSRKDQYLPIAPDFANWLAETDEFQRFGKVFAVPVEDGKPYSLDRVSKVLTAIGKAAGVKVAEETGRKVKYASAHDLRRSFGNRWARKVAPALLQKLMRHAEISTTMRYYVDLDSDSIADELWEIEGVGTSVGTGEQDTTSKPEQPR